jgi:putative membrane protein
MPRMSSLLRFILRLAASAVAVWVATALPGISLTTDVLWKKALTLVVVALIFGVVNAVIKPVVKTVGCAFYLLTLGLVALVVNGLLLWLTSWICGKLDVPFEVHGFWNAMFGALIIALAGWVLGGVVEKSTKKR